MSTKIEMLIKIAGRYEFANVGEYIRTMQRDKDLLDIVETPAQINAMLLYCFESAHRRELPERIRKVLLKL